MLIAFICHVQACECVGPQSLYGAVLYSASSLFTPNAAWCPPAQSSVPSGDAARSGQFDISHPLCDFLHGVKWKHQSLKPLPNQSAAWMCTSVAVWLAAALTVSQCRVILLPPVFTRLCSAWITSAMFHLLCVWNQGPSELEAIEGSVHCHYITFLLQSSSNFFFFNLGPCLARESKGTCSQMNQEIERGRNVYQLLRGRPQRPTGSKNTCLFLNI